MINGRRHSAAGEFSGSDRLRPIHQLEALGVIRTLEVIGEWCRDTIVDLHVDNTAVEHTLMRGSKGDPFLTEVAKALLHWQLKENVIVKVHRVTSKDNVVADYLSRNFDRNDHRLHPKYVEDMQRRWGIRFTVDACASEFNAQVERFIAKDPSPTGHPGLVAVNVFSYSFPPWEVLYANPPWPIIEPLWKHFRECKAHGVIVYPHRPLLQWFHSIQQRCKESVVIAKKGDRGVFLQPSRAYARSVGVVPWDVWASYFDFRLTT